MAALIFQILSLAVGAWQSFATGGVANTAKLADTLVKIAQSANQAYLAHTGAPIDPTLLKPIEPIP